MPDIRNGNDGILYAIDLNLPTKNPSCHLMTKLLKYLQFRTNFDKSKILTCLLQYLTSKPTN